MRLMYSWFGLASVLWQHAVQPCRTPSAEAGGAQGTLAYVLVRDWLKRYASTHHHGSQRQSA